MRTSGSARASCRRSTRRFPASGACATFGAAGATIVSCGSPSACYDIRKRYRRSLLGPFWITISLGAFILGLSFIYVPLVGGNMNSFLPFLAFGFIAWQFISQLVLDGCNVFIANGPIIQQLRAPLSIYIYQTVWRHLIILAHNLLIYVLIVVALWHLAELADAARHPRHPPRQHQRRILRHDSRNAVRPVPRHPADRADHHPDDVPADADPVAAGSNPGREFVYLFNPFFYLVQIIREPLEGVSPSLFIWAVAVGLTAVGFLVSLLFFSRFRNRIVYWL